MADQRAGDRHKAVPKAVRMPGGLEAWYRQHAASTGRSLNAALVAALEEYRQRYEPPAAVTAGVRIGITADPRQPPGTVSVVAPGEEVTQVRSFALAPEPEGCPHPPARILRGLCNACGNYVGS